jgi:predicted secreted protein
MKQTKRLFCAAVMIIAAMTIPVRYASAQQTGGNARDLGRALGGKAKVNGATVTLTGDVQVARSLTVPEGVTLDLTADKVRLFLKGGQH